MRGTFLDLKAFEDVLICRENAFEPSTCRGISRRGVTYNKAGTRVVMPRTTEPSPIKEASPATGHTPILRAINLHASNE